MDGPDTITELELILVDRQVSRMPIISKPFDNGFRVRRIGRLRRILGLPLSRILRLPSACHQSGYLVSAYGRRSEPKLRDAIDLNQG